MFWSCVCTCMTCHCKVTEPERHGVLTERAHLLAQKASSSRLMQRKGKHLMCGTPLCYFGFNLGLQH